MEKLSFRGSELVRWGDCARRALAERLGTEKRREYLGRPMGVGIGSLMGTVLHKYFETGFEEGNAEEWLMEALKEQGEKWDGVRDDTKTAGMTQACKQLREAIEMLRETAGIWRSSGRLEEQMQCDVEINGLTVEVTGCPDRVEGEWVHDLKMSVAPVSSYAAQMGCYIYLTEKTLGEKMAGAKIWQVSRTGKTVKGYEILREPAIDSFWLALNTAVHYCRTYDETEDFSGVPVNPSSRLCSGNYCRAFGTPFCSAGDSGVLFMERARGKIK